MIGDALKVKGQWRYLYRAVDKYGETIDFLLTEDRDKEAALRFLKKAIRRNGSPETITIDGSAANEAAIKRYNQEHGTAIAIRQVKYLITSFTAASDTLVGIELMHMIKKKQLMVETGDEGLSAAAQFYALAA
jgi:transposase-like protein